MSEYKPNTDLLMTEVYSWEFPEVSMILGKTAYPASISNNNLNMFDANIAVQQTYEFDPPLELPETEHGTLDLDELNEVFIDRIKAVAEKQLPGLSTFENRYVGHGSSDLLAKIIMEGVAKGEIKKIAVIDGEYEGYKAYADAVNLPVVVYNSLENAPEPQEGVVWFISNPSAVDGNQINPEVFQDFVDAGHETVVDAAYAGLTKPVSIDVSAENILAVTTSPSKVFGVFRRRLTGIAYTRRPVASLYGSKWFKDVPAMFETLKLYETLGLEDIQHKYRKVQEMLCEELTNEFGVEVVPSEVLLLGQISANEVEEAGLEERLAPFKRAKNYRLGLKRLFGDYNEYRANKFSEYR